MADRKRKRWIWPVAFTVAVVLLAMIALNREPVELDRDTAEGTVQAYLQAIGDSDYEMAFSYLDPEQYEGCTAADLATHIDHGDPFTAVFDTANIEELSDHETIVPVQMRFGTSGMFSSGWTTWESFVVSNASSTWLITEEAWPYFVWSCREEGF